MGLRRGVFSKIAVRVSAAVSACWARSPTAGRRGALPPGLPPPYYDPFVRQLVKCGRYVLECGGGVIAEPQRAIDELRGRYGDQGLRDRCHALLFEQGPGAEYPEGIESTALGIIYRLGDLTALQELEETRQRLLQLSQASNLSVALPALHTRLEHCDWLIAGLCRRLGRSLPDGIPALADEEAGRLFD